MADGTMNSSAFNRDLTIVGLPTTRRVFADRRASQSARLSDIFESLIKLPIGWDGLSAKPVAFSNASYASQLLDHICTPDVPPPSVVPGYNGDLQLEWHTENISVEIHIVEPYVASLWCSNAQICPDGEAIFFRHDISASVAAMRLLSEPVYATHQAAA